MVGNRLKENREEKKERKKSYNFLGVAIRNIPFAKRNTFLSYIFSTYTLFNKELFLISSQHIEPKFWLIKAVNHIQNTMNNEIQSFDDNFQVRFITFIFFNKEIYIFKSLNIIKSFYIIYFW